MIDTTLPETDAQIGIIVRTLLEYARNYVFVSMDEREIRGTDFAAEEFIRGAVGEDSQAEFDAYMEVYQSLKSQEREKKR